MGDAGATSLAAALKGNATLTRLDITREWRTGACLAEISVHNVINSCRPGAHHYQVTPLARLDVPHSRVR